MPEHKPPETIEELFTYRLHVLKKRTDRALDEAFRGGVGLPLTETRVLLSAGAFGPVSVSRLGQVSNLDRSQASRATDVLEKKGLLRKTSSESDGRGIEVTLTPLGKRLFMRAAKISRQCNAEFLQALDEAERQALNQAMHKLLDT